MTRFTFIVNSWFDVKVDEDRDLIVGSSDTNGNEFEFVIRDNYLGKKWLKTLIRDLENKKEKQTGEKGNEDN